MSRLGIFIADGCEEVEALTVVDIVWSCSCPLFYR